MSKLIYLVTLIITLVIPKQLFAQNIPLPNADPNRGSPERSSGAGGRVKPDINDSVAPSLPGSSSGDNRKPRNRLNRNRRRRVKRLIFPLPIQEDIEKIDPETKLRTSCIKSTNNQPLLTALIPQKSHVGKTIKDSPAVFVYIPNNTADAGKFRLVNHQNEEIYHRDLKLPKKSGIIKMNIPANVKIKVGKTYRWNFTIVCNLQDRSQDQSVKGAIQKIEPDSQLTDNLLKAKPLIKAKIYAKNLIWYDTLEAIASVKKDYPLDWKSLLKSVGLEEFSQEKILDCCNTGKTEK